MVAMVDNWKERLDANFETYSTISLRVIVCNLNNYLSLYLMWLTENVW